MSGYDYEPKENSAYLRLKSKGEKVKIRLVSEPIHFEEADMNGKPADRFAWTVIDRSTGDIKAYKAGVMVYKEIKKYATDEDWGDPTGYDFTVERTEEKGRYYAVTPSPNKKPLSDEEKTTVKDSGIDLLKMFSVSDTVPISDEESQNKQAEKQMVITADDGDGMDLENIPFD